MLQERRLAAVRELVRLLKPGGRALIYVWAFEQEYNKQRSKYLKEPNKEHPENLSPAVSTSEDTGEPNGKPRTHINERLENHHGPVDSTQNVTEGKLSVHTNRTAFNTQDLLVPWHLKDGKRRGDGESEEAGKRDKRTEKSKKTSSDSCSLSNASSKTELESNHDSNRGLDASEAEPGADDGAASSSTVKSVSESGPVPVFHRYYHVFQQGELEQMCGQVAGVKVQSSYHDQGNWCVILEKS